MLRLCLRRAAERMVNCTPPGGNLSALPAWASNAMARRWSNTPAGFHSPVRAIIEAGPLALPLPTAVGQALSHLETGSPLGILDALIPGRMQSHASTVEVPQRAA